jgi:hypothetical protein
MSLAVLPIPKVGCTSMCRWWNEIHPYDIKAGSARKKACETFGANSEEDFLKVDKMLAFLRDPFDRCLSAFLHLGVIRTPNTRAERGIGHQIRTFFDFVKRLAGNDRYLMSDIHWVPQFYWLKPMYIRGWVSDKLDVRPLSEMTGTLSWIAQERVGAEIIPPHKSYVTYGNEVIEGAEHITIEGLERMDVMPHKESFASSEILELLWGPYCMDFARFNRARDEYK